jgi:ribonuclease HI
MKSYFYDFVIYTDGSCFDNGSKNNHGGWACVILDGSLDKGDSIACASKHSGKVLNTTNNRMEIQAVIEGLARCPDKSLVKIVTDSQYVIGTMTKNWKRNKNTDLWDKLCLEVNRMKDVSFEWVKGHNGDEINELVDGLSRYK